MLFVVFYLNLQAQQINYQVIKDNPSFFTHVKAGFFYDADFSKDNNRAVYNFQAAVNIGERIAISGEFANAYKKWDNVRKKAVNDFSKSYMNITGRGTFFFKIDKQKEDTKVSLKKTVSNSVYYTITDETFIMAPATTIRKIGVTGSAGFFRNNYLDNHKYDSVFQVSDQNGVNVSSLNFGTSYSGLRISGGFHISIAKNFVINATNSQTGERYGRKSVRNKTEVFVEMLYMPSVAVESSLIAKSENGGAAYNINQKPDVKSLGWRLMVESFTTGLAGIGIRFEIGARPGIKYDISSAGKLKNMYLSAGFFAALSK
jgi:hypothetical protein